MIDFKLALQIVGVCLGLLYLWLEYRASIWLWVVGIIMPIVHSVLYFRSGLYADFSMQLYYILAGIYGLTVWMGWSHKRGNGERQEVEISHTPGRTWIAIVVLYLALHAAIYTLLVCYTDSTVPFLDSATTALCIVAYWMLSRKYVEQWLVWLLVDAITVGLYIYKGIPLTAALYMLYTVLAVVGYRRWLRMMKS